MRPLRFIVPVLFAGASVLPALASNDPGFAKQWGLSKIGAEAAWATATGDGITIAIIDSGVDLGHEDLANKIVPGVDYIDGGTPQDENGHGTHVAGIAAASTGNGVGVAGTAPGAKILPMRVLGPDGSCSPCSTAAAIDESVARGADVINLSLSQLGKSVLGPSQSFADALERAWAAGVIPVLAAGNDYLLMSGYEKNSAIVVSASNRNDQKPDFSSEVGRAKWAMAAPGGGSTFDAQANDVFSTDWDGSKTNLYGYKAGTSMSAPHVAGAAAILRSMGLSPQQTVDRLLATAVDIGSVGHDTTFGSGRLDLAAAVRGLSPAGPVSPPPTGLPFGKGKPRPSTSAVPVTSPAATLAPPSGPQPTPDPSPIIAGAPKDPGRPSTGVPGAIVMAVVAAASGGVGIYFFRFRAKRF